MERRRCFLEGIDFEILKKRNDLLSLIREPGFYRYFLFVRSKFLNELENKVHFSYIAI